MNNNPASHDLPARLRALSNIDLLTRIKRLTETEHRTTLAILHHLNEIERRRLFADLGYSSLFDYCVRALDYSTSAAGRRIQAARCIRRSRHVRDLLESRELDLSTLSLIESLLDGSSDDDEILERVRGRSYREVKRVVSEYRPKDPFPDRIEPVCVTTPGAGSERMVSVQFLANEELMEKFEAVRELLSNRVPGATVADVLGVLVNEYLERHDPVARERRRETREAQKGQVTREAHATRREQDHSRRRESRRVPAIVRDRVFVRDGGRCTHVSRDGVRCNTTHALQIDHIRPYALGGGSEPDNLRLLCAAHNRLAAERALGKHVMAPFWKRE